MLTMFERIHTQWISYTQPCPPVAPLAFLQLGEGQPRVYWSAGTFAAAGYGVAALIRADGPDRFERTHEQLADLFSHIELLGNTEIPARVFGGFAFHEDFQPAGRWSAFASGYFVLPRYLLTQQGEQTWLTINQPVDDPETFDDLVLQDEHETLCAWMRALDFMPTTAIKTVSIHSEVTVAQWSDQIDTITGSIHRGLLDKVVLSRPRDVQFTAPVDPLPAMQTLEQKYPNTYRFLIEPEAGSAFFGATPELLAERHGQQLVTAALAGSRPRGTTPSDDKKFADELMASEKDRHEHQLVVDALREHLQPLSTEIEIPDQPSIVRLNNIQHLFTPVKATLTNGTDIVEIASDLHPTPALGGYPQRTSLTMLRQLETYERGWYASPVGWVDQSGDGMFAVAIRSAVSNGNRARLFAGAGIVGDSEADKEWNETELKFRPLMDALKVDPNAGR